MADKRQSKVGPRSQDIHLSSHSDTREISTIRQNVEALLPSALLLMLTCAGPAMAQTAQSNALAPIDLHPGVTNTFPSATHTFPSAANKIAQQAPAPQFIPTDVTPFTVTGERTNFAPGYKFRIFQKLPARLWFNSTTEVSQRYETNVFFTYNRPRSDYVFRALPNVTVGYNLLKNTSVYCNYFVIKDQFAQHPHELNFPTTMSLSIGARQDFPIGRKTSIQLDIQARELWQTSHLHQFDFIPALNVTHVFTPNHIIFGSVLLQMRGREFFAAPTRELDPFYTLGYVYRRGQWTFVANDTIVNSWRTPPFRGSIPQQGNATMIADIEISHPVVTKFPALLAFVRAEPIYNWSSHKAPGLSGFDFRLFAGLRITFNKPSYYGAIENLRQQLLESESTPKSPSISARPKDAEQKAEKRRTTSQATPPPLILLPWEEPMKLFIHQPQSAAQPDGAPAPSARGNIGRPPLSTDDQLGSRVES